MHNMLPQLAALDCPDLSGKTLATWPVKLLDQYKQPRRHYHAMPSRDKSHSALIAGAVPASFSSTLAQGTAA